MCPDFFRLPISLYNIDQGDFKIVFSEALCGGESDTTRAAGDQNMCTLHNVLERSVFDLSQDVVLDVWKRTCL